MNQYDHHSIEQFATLLGDELYAYYAHWGSRHQRLFYFEGQDPFGFETPADAISALYWGLSRRARNHMTEALVDVIGSDLRLIPADGLIQLIMTIGLIHRIDALHPMVKVLGQRSEGAEALRPVFASAIMVIKGFAPKAQAISAARNLASFITFPNDLVYDVLEILIRDRHVPWNESVQEMLPRMECDYSPEEHVRIATRLAHVAREIVRRVSLAEIETGLSAVIAPDLDYLLDYHHGIIPDRNPLGLLITRLLQTDDAPLVVSGDILVARDSEASHRIRDVSTFDVFRQVETAVPEMRWVEFGEQKLAA